MFNTFSIDFPGLLPQTKRKNKFLIVAVVLMISWVLVMPSISQAADATIKVSRDEVAQHFSSPRALWIDRGPALTSAALNTPVTAPGTLPKMTAAYSPPSNGRAEKIIEILKREISWKEPAQTGTLFFQPF